MNVVQLRYFQYNNILRLSSDSIFKMSLAERLVLSTVEASQSQALI